jgi:hypothetical protein
MQARQNTYYSCRKRQKKTNSRSHFKRTEQIENKFGRNEENYLVDVLDQTDGQTELQKLLNRAYRRRKRREKENIGENGGNDVQMAGISLKTDSRSSCSPFCCVTQVLAV